MLTYTLEQAAANSDGNLSPTPAAPDLAPQADETSPAAMSSDEPMTQTFPTVAGQQYMLSFSLGAYSTTDETLERNLTLKVTGDSVLLLQPMLLLVPGNGTSWGEQNIYLTADGENLTVTIEDESSASENVRVFWDQVRLSL